MNPFIKDQSLWINDVEMRMVRQIGTDEVQLEKLTSGEITTHKTFNLLGQYVRGELLTAAQRRHMKSMGEKKPRPPARMDRMSPPARSKSRRKMDILIRLNNRGSFQKSRKELDEDLKVVAAARGESGAPHVSTVYRWHNEYLRAQCDVRAIFYKFDRQGGKGQPRLHPEVEGIILEKIETIFLARKRSSASEVHNAVVLEIQKRNNAKIKSEWLAEPGLRTIQRRLAELYAFDLAVARFGIKEAERRFAHHLGARAVTRVLELVEIDHSPIDALVTDENGIVIGRPTITVVLDRRSRCVLGYHLSLAGHGTQAVFAALRHALLPKTYLKERYADLELEWECFGWFECLLMDNGREFHAEAIIDALMNLSIATEFARSRTPNDKPYVERFLRTLNYGFIHRLPGTTLAKVHQRIGFKAEEEACLTLAELDRLIHVWICQVYHVRPHAGLDGRAPMAVWKEGAAAHPPQLKANSEDLDIEFSQCDSSAIQHYGIDLNTFVYRSPRLLTLRRMLPEGARVDVKWPAHAAAHIYVWDPMNEEYFKVENKDSQYASLTVEQAKAAKKAKASADPSSQLAIAAGEAVAREMAATALSEKSLKKRRKGARFANMTSEASRHGVKAATQVEAEAVPVACTSKEAGNRSLRTLNVPRVELELGSDADLQEQGDQV
jgi:putative transposase